MASNVNLSSILSSSGLDWQSVIDQLMEVEAAPKTRLEKEKTTNTERDTALQDVGTLLTDLKSAGKALGADGLFTKRTAATSSTSSTWSASADNATETGTYTVAVSQLATSAKLRGTNNIGLPISDSTNVSGITLSSMRTATAVTAGSFTINNKQISLSLSDSLQDVFDKISAGTDGKVTAAYDPTTDKITLSSSSGELVLGAANDTSNFLSAAKLNNNGTTTSSSSASLGSVALNATLANSALSTAITNVDTSGNGAFTINGQSISYNVNSDSLATVIARINASSAGVKAAYDSTNDRVVITNNATGDIGFSLSEGAGGLVAALGLGTGQSTLLHGQNALFTINGGTTLSSSTNTFDSSVHGITGLSIKASTATTENIVVKADTDSIKSTVNDFIYAYNSVLSYIDASSEIKVSGTTVTTETLSYNHEVQDWTRKLRSIVFSSGMGNGSIDHLTDLGINVSSADKESLYLADSDKLLEALTNNASDVSSFFNSSSNGLIAKLNTFFDSTIGSDGEGGTLGIMRDNITKENTNIDEQIATIERRLEQQRELLVTAFTNMNTYQTKMESVQKQIDSLSSSLTWYSNK